MGEGGSNFCLTVKGLMMPDLWRGSLMELKSTEICQICRLPYHSLLLLLFACLQDSVSPSFSLYSFCLITDLENNYMY